MRTIELPFKFRPRKYQIPLFNSLDTKKRAVAVCHRRWGKDKTALNLLIKKMPERIGTYFYIFPEYSQAKKAIWKGMDKLGMPYLDHFPPDMIKKKNENEMSIEFHGNHGAPGSIFQLVGSDNYNSLMSTNPVGCVFSEYALQDPYAWQYLSPILDENDGWAVFLYTFRGKNHAWNLYQMAKNNPDWFCQIMTVDNTFLDDGKTRVISRAIIDKARREGRDEDVIQEDYYCIPAAAARGSFYGKWIAKAEGAKPPRITSVPYQEGFPVSTYWDLGKGENMCIWFAQDFGPNIHFIDYVQGEGEGMPFFAQVLQDKKYVYKAHYMPPDIDATDIGSGKTLRATAKALGINPIVDIPDISIESGIHAARMIFSRCWFDQVKCERGLNGLRDYHKKYDKTSKTYMPIPDPRQWARHPADAFRTFAVGHTDRIPTGNPQIAFQHRGQGGG